MRHKCRTAKDFLACDISERDWALFIGFMADKTLSQLGREHGLTQGGVKQVCARVGLALLLDLPPDQIKTLITTRLERWPAKWAALGAPS